MVDLAALFEAAQPELDELSTSTGERPGRGPGGAGGGDDEEEDGGKGPPPGAGPPFGRP